MADEKSLELNELEEPAPAPKTGEDEEAEATFAEAAGFTDMPRTARDLEAVYDIPVQVSAQSDHAG